MHVISTLEIGSQGLPDITNAARREELVGRLKLYELGHASMSGVEIEAAQNLLPAPVLPTTITETRRNQLIIEAMML
jgi:hypothetical protein